MKAIKGSSSKLAANTKIQGKTTKLATMKGKTAPKQQHAASHKGDDNLHTWVKSDKPVSLKGKFEDIDGLTNIVRIAMKGVKPQVFYQFASTVEIPDKYLAELLNTSARTLSNYKEQNKTLEPVKGEHLLKLIALFKKGEEVFGNLNEFRGWLFKPKLNNDFVPIDWLVTPGGIDLVSQEMDRMAHGYPV